MHETKNTCKNKIKCYSSGIGYITPLQQMETRFWGQNDFGFSLGKGFGAFKGLRSPEIQKNKFARKRMPLLLLLLFRFYPPTT